MRAAPATGTPQGPGEQRFAQRRPRALSGALSRDVSLRVPLGRGRVLSPIGFGFATAGVVLVSYAWAVGARPLVLPGMLCLAITVIGLVTARGITGVSLVAASPRVQVTLGEELRLEIDVLAARSQPPLRLRAEVAGLPPLVGASPPLRAGERVTVVLQGLATQRLLARAVKVTVTDAGALGIASASRAWALTVAVAVVPGWHPCPAPARTDGPGLDNGDEGFTTHGRPRWSGVEPRGLRPLRGGDPWRAVHGRASARRGRPMVREWEPPAIARRRVVVALVLGADAQGDDTARAQSEALVREAASLAIACRRAGDEVVLAGCFPDATGHRRPAVAPGGDDDAILVALAAMSYGDVVPLATVAGATRGSAVSGSAGPGPVLCIVAVGPGAHHPEGDLARLGSGSCELLVLDGEEPVHAVA